MKLRKVIRQGCNTAVSEAQREMWRAIYLLEKRTSHLKKVPPFPKKPVTPKSETTVTQNVDDWLMVPSDTADFARKVNLLAELQRLYGMMSSKERFQSVCILDAIDIVTTILDADGR